MRNCASVKSGFDDGRICTDRCRGELILSPDIAQRTRKEKERRTNDEAGVTRAGADGDDGDDSADEISHVFSYQIFCLPFIQWDGRLCRATFRTTLRR